ncbi:eukaryotic translation initiation factor 4E-binding protein Mextli-like isoform X1 [Macrosteles quadrilineatus]|uniref:eukaryotic translation initiation factor 4E-binding protein Mextli-like isoform X1 n=1 Tax=Macrosteles quadrilineatus TaxID=74068 RepID=UPI0023E2CEE0|nr:eukaryotic translation initiation factor 4E-binding protein Mextli-like isoform X1 [Macrosteles quadrilineatus]
MAAPPLMRSLSTKAEQNKKLQRPRPLRTSSSQSRISADFTNIDHLQELMILVDSVSQSILDQNYSDKLISNIAAMSVRLKQNGYQLESIYKDQLDRAFNIFRDGCQNEFLLCSTRLHLLQLVELRANHWTDTDKTQFYYSAKMAAEMEPSITTPDTNTTTIPMTTSSPPTPPVLGPGEVLKTSGKFSKPTKIPGKNYCKDEVVIRNSDSGKAEYMRPLIIKSPVVWNTARYLYPPTFFPRHAPIYMGPPPRPWAVNPGAKERLVQITGPSEDKINNARQLMEDTIRRNASPIREGGDRERIGGSNSSLNSSASDESGRNPLQAFTLAGSRRSLPHSFSTNDANLGEYKYTVTLGHDVVKITGTNHDVVKNARLVLEEYYNIWLQKNYSGDCFGMDEDVFLDSAVAADIGMMHLNPLDPGNGKTHPVSSSSGDSDDVTCISTITPPDAGLGYAPLYSPSVSEPIDTTPLSPLSLDSAHTRKYSREFLLSCSLSQHSHATPLQWPSISERFPAIVKKQVPFNPAAFLARPVSSAVISPSQCPNDDSD